MELIENGVRNWASILDGVTRAQAARTNRLPVLSAPLALMPDAHLGMGATIGSVLVMEDAVVPSAVGVDIGCGMAARRLDMDRAELDVRQTEEYESGPLSDWQTAMARLVPAGLGSWHGSSSDAADAWIEQNPPPATLGQKGRAKVGVQLGTLGSGNHFVEIALDEYDGVWLLLHSGSRGPGNMLAQVHQKVAEELTGALAAAATEEKSLAWLISGTPEFEAYIHDLKWSQEYAFENRRQLLDGAHRAVEDALGRDVQTLDQVNCHHNYANREYVVELGKRAWVTRKGAIYAGFGSRGLIPGAMGQASYIVSGRGNNDSYQSCSHGAGRVMSRGQARRELDPASFDMLMQGVTWQDQSAKALIDEHPAAYKPVETVMADQTDLVLVEHALHAIANYKGVEDRRR